MLVFIIGYAPLIFQCPLNFAKSKSAGVIFRGSLSSRIFQNRENREFKNPRKLRRIRHVNCETNIIVCISSVLRPGSKWLFLFKITFLFIICRVLDLMINHKNIFTIRNDLTYKKMTSVIDREICNIFVFLKSSREFNMSWKTFVQKC